LDIRSQLEHANLIPVESSTLTPEMIRDLSQEFSVLLVCDIAKNPNNAQRSEYVKALVDGDVISTELMDGVLADETLVIIVPFHTLQIAERTYRNIDHASHFVTVWLDGAPYITAC